VTLHYRRAGSNIFNRVLMEPIGDTGFFTVAIETKPTDLRAFEYYAQALDLNGNRTVKGFAFEPFVRVLTESTAPGIASAPEPAEDKADEDIAAVSVATTPVGSSNNNSDTRRWIYIALGVLAAGAVASQLGGSDGGGGGGNTGNNDLVPFTINTQDPLE